MNISRFQPGDKVVLDTPSSTCVMTKDVDTALKKGPLTVTEVVPVPPPQCNCYADYADDYGIGPHTSGCPRSAGPWGFVGHPQCYTSRISTAGSSRAASRRESHRGSPVPGS